VTTSATDNIHALAGTLDGVDSQLLVYDGDFLDLAARFAPLEGTVLLLSGGELDCARYHLLGTLPWLTLRGRRGAMRLASGEAVMGMDTDPLAALRRVLATYHHTITTDSRDAAPLQAGLMGYLAYDLKDCLETLPRTCLDDLQLPHLCLYAPGAVIVHDRTTAQTRVFFPRRRIDGKSVNEATRRRFFKLLNADPPAVESFSGGGGGFRSNFTRTDYEAAVAHIRDYIAAGDIYQVNLSQRFEMGFEGSAFALLRDLFRRNPAPFFSFVNAGDHQVVSTSPERFLLQQGERVETRPIKGTRPRGKTAARDRRLAAELIGSLKDDAELSMIVDLMRNDIGRVCRQGSVKVTHHKKLEKYENVYHLVSIVEGRLDKGLGSADLIAATFPGGSITGCPKIRAMEIIDELEPHCRHVYTGSLGYISFHESMDLSIAIRTATVTGRRVIFSVGGGIVFDSDPAAEYEETLHKGQTLMTAFKGQEGRISRPTMVWINGVFKPAHEATVAIDDTGFQYGFGFFETLRIDHGHILRLDQHLARFHHTWRQLFGARPQDFTWDQIIDQVVSRNGLAQRTAAVKILAAAGPSGVPPSEGTILVTARRYRHRLTGRKERGLHLARYPHARQTPLADHKTMNYLYYYLAGRWAQEKGADEALILNPDGSISETNTANLILVRQGTVIQPQSPYVLPGVMQAAVTAALKSQGYSLQHNPTTMADLLSAEEVLLSNALMGVVPVLSLDNTRLNPPSDLWQRLNRALGITIP
jgi:para-aminobenzoate synthetase component 1